MSRVSRSRCSALTALPLLLAAGCSRLPAAPDAPESFRASGGITRQAPATYKGFWTLNFEGSSFVPCGSSERWWLGASRESTLRAQLKAVAGEGFLVEHGHPQPVYIEVRGRVSEPGHFGHLGAYSRDLEVLAANVVRLPSASDCVSPQ